MELDFIIDKLTNSIENRVTGDRFTTDISVVNKKDISNASKKNGWQFDWKAEFKQKGREIYKLTITNNLALQGLN